MKRFISIMLLMLLIAPPVVTFSWLHMKKRMLRKEIKWKIINGIDKEELVLLTFSNDQVEACLKWHHSAEFEFMGEMYDVVETIFFDDSVSYYCWWDHEETLLNKKLKAMLALSAGKSKQERQQINYIIQFFQSIFFIENQFGSNSMIFNNTRLDITYFFVVKTAGIIPPVPPPRLNSRFI